MAARTKRCEGCGKRHQATIAWCQTCQAAYNRGLKQVEKEHLLVDTAGGSWWVWSKKGEVLVIGKPTKHAAILALARGEDEDEENPISRKPKLSESGRRALLFFVPRVIDSNCGPQRLKGYDTMGPGGGGGSNATWDALEKAGYVVRAGSGHIDAGNFSWRAPRYRITSAGLAALGMNGPVSIDENPISTSTRNVIVGVALVGGLVAFVKLVL